MAAALFRRALHLRRVLPSPTSPLPVASFHRFFSSFTPTTSASQQNAATPIDLSSDESRRRLINRLVYRSKQRGSLPLVSENPDLWKWLSGQDQPPEDLNSNPVFSAIKSKITENLMKHASPETRSTPGQPWVRGWDDISNGKDGPKYGNQ